MVICTGRGIDREFFSALDEAKTLIARWREKYNPVRPNSTLSYRSPAPQECLLNAQLLSASGLT